MFKKFDRLVKEVNEARSFLEEIRNLLILSSWSSAARNHNNPLARAASLGFSQADEDGITIDIVERIGIRRGVFLELGVGNGFQNLTLVLLALGWSGTWVDACELNSAFSKSDRLRFVKKWITSENIVELVSDGSGGVQNIDFLSIDLDGNDFWILRSLLQHGLKPSVIALEYNGRFPPGVRWVMPYNPHHRWNRTDYFGASLSAYCELLGRYGYRLVACNPATGLNAFFVEESFSEKFSDVPQSIEDIWVAPRYARPTKLNHPLATETIEVLTRDDIV